MGFFNLFFGILELTGLVGYVNGVRFEAGESVEFFLNEGVYTLIIYPLVLLVVGIFSVVMGFINLGALPVKSKKEELIRTLLGASLIFVGALIFWDIIIV